ncbi:C-type mannose receptor 2 [Ictalurus punctatus]|uniref:C-type mannose receptor 2 n=1 Tax=Ictalurus punctatus TaxID=7998 RepID=A0A2D0SN92_ICTPU|nr:C-type mannose receptor 2 [Ictalurus punctatus]
MAIIESNDNMIQLQNEAQRVQFSSSAWIGLYNDINSWRWSFGNEPLGSVKKWAGVEPNNSSGNQQCVALLTTGWTDRICTETLPFVCFDGNNTGNYSYTYFSNKKSWYDAQKYCRQYHTDLANTRDATEYSAVYNLVTPLTMFTWIGLFRDSWKWVDTTILSTISWMPGKSDNALGNENCGYLSNGQAVDTQCSDVMPFFCYSVITGMKQIISVKVRSSEDMNGAVIMAVTLEQLKQKLQDHGIAGDTTVKWREQPDGVVFHKEK